MKLLIEVGADVNCGAGIYSGRAPLIVTAENGEPSKIKLLLSAGADVNISNDDITKLGHYFQQNYETGTDIDPRKLQECVMFYILFFFCRRGQENLHDMTLNTYSVQTDDKGRKYVYQAIDEIDKNHTADDSDPTNQGRMYENPGKNNPKIFNVQLI